MDKDEQILIQLNIDISKYENEGNREKLSSLIAPKLAFIRADQKTLDVVRNFFSIKLKSWQKMKLLVKL